MRSELSPHCRAPLLPFPASGTPAQKLEYCVWYTTFAPSVFNTQPWRFTPNGDRMLLWADRSRALSFLDPDGRELTISCGAALHHMRIATRHFGYRCDVARLPHPASADLLARVSLGPAVSASPADERQFGSIFERHTNRMSFSECQIPGAVLDRLCRTAPEDGISVQVVADQAAQDELRRLILQGDRDLVADSRYRRELARWIRSDESANDGMPVDRLAMPGLIAVGTAHADRTFDTGLLFEARERQLTSDAPVLVLMTSPADVPLEWIKTGEAMSSLLLDAAAEGISASFLNSPIEVLNLRPEVGAAAGSRGVPQLLIRLGYGPVIDGTPRRDVRDVVADTDAPGTAAEETSVSLKSPEWSS